MAPAKPYFFEEGQEYDFTVNSRVQLPPDDDFFLILISPFQTRHLLAEKNYLHYNLYPGQKIRCRIDKINCAGKIFLEPQHPVYKENNVYDFPVKGIEDIINSEGKHEKMLVVEDCWHNEIYINASEIDTTATTSVLCHVDRIKKSKLYLSPVRNLSIVEEKKIGEEYIFKVIRVVTLAEDEEYFELHDLSGNIHYLRKKYFDDYGFNEGDLIKCRLTAQPAMFRHYLEPVHPEYQPGHVYEFIFAGTETYTNESGTETKMMVVFDSKEKKYFVSCDDPKKSDVVVGSRIRCRVTNIRMSRLALECI